MSAPATSAHPLRFSATVRPAVGGSAWRSRLRRLVDVGYATLTATDHLRSGGVWSTVASAAAVAPTARIGPLVVNGDLTHPVQIAREAITADVLSEGRVELGIGAGWDAADRAAHGPAGRSPAQRVERLAESVAILSLLLAGQPAEFDGEYFSVSVGAHEALRPSQRRIPLLIGGGGPRILALAVDHADIVSVYRNLRHGHRERWLAESRDEFEGRLDSVRSRIVRRNTPVELHVLLLRAIVTDHPEAVRERVAGEFGLSPREVAESPHFVIGASTEIADELRRRREKWGVTYYSVAHDEDQLAFGRVIDQLAAGC